jgi:glucose/arabinose dehydrogenase
MVASTALLITTNASAEVLRGRDAFGDWTTDAPGVRRKILVEDLPKPHEVPSSKNRPKMVDRPEGAWPKVPEGFKVELYAEKLKEPRVIVTAPNGDVLVAESKSDRISILRDADGDGKPDLNQVFASGLKQPFGIAFYPVGEAPEYVYVANTNAVVRFPYASGQLKVEGEPELITELSGGGQLTGGGHWTRDIVFSNDGKKLYVSVGSKSNVSDDEDEADRARIFECDPDGKNKRVYAWGIRNPVGLAVYPETGDVWTSVNERDELGDNLPPDYVTRVKEGGFYGWPWFYTGGHEDPSHAGKKPELRDQVIVPDVLLQSHTASLDLVFYTGKKFPKEYNNHLFAAQHGSWNRERRTGYKLIRVPVEEGRATGEYEDFMTGFVTDKGDVWGRPVGVTVTSDGALLVSDDGGNCIWRVTYEGKGKR